MFSALNLRNPDFIIVQKQTEMRRQGPPGATRAQDWLYWGFTV